MRLPLIFIWMWRLRYNDVPRLCMNCVKCKGGNNMRYLEWIDKKLYKVMILFFLCIAGIALNACNRTEMSDSGFFTTLKLGAYYGEDLLIVQYPSGEQAVRLPIDAAVMGFPASSNDHTGNETELIEGISVLYGKKTDGLQWAVVCSGPSAGAMPINILLSKDNGKSWNSITAHYDKHNSGLPSYVVIGAGFQSAERGFLCYRHTMDMGPEIYMTTDSGCSWDRLAVQIPQEFSEYTMDPYSPIITDQSVSFPIVMYDQHGFSQIKYLSTVDFEVWKWTDQ